MVIRASPVVAVVYIWSTGVVLECVSEEPTGPGSPLAGKLGGVPNAHRAPVNGDRRGASTVAPCRGSLGVHS